MLLEISKFKGIKEAVNHLDEYNLEAVLILSNITVPGMSGLQLLRRIKETIQP
jgi:CheY-like chemotaxis protein